MSEQSTSLARPIRAELQRQANNSGAIVKYALMRPENGVLIMVFSLLSAASALFAFPVAWFPWWAWAGIGALSLAVMVGASLTDSDANADLLLSLFQEQFDPRRLEEPEFRRAVEKALTYQREIEHLVSRQDDGPVRDSLEEAATQLGDWVRNVYRLAVRVDAYENDHLLDRQRESVPRQLEDLKERRRRERDDEIQQQIDQLVASKQSQREALTELDSRMKRAELQIQQSLTAMETIYNQAQLMSTQEADAGESERLQQEIHEQVEWLDGMVQTLNEVYSPESKGLG